MGRVTRKRVYDSPIDVIHKVATPHKRKHNSKRVTAASIRITSTPKASQKKKSTAASVTVPKSPYPDEDFPLSQAPCVVGWDSRNDACSGGNNARIADILKGLKKDPKESKGAESLPSTPPLLHIQYNHRRKGQRGRPGRKKPTVIEQHAEDIMLQLQAAIKVDETKEKPAEESLRRITRSQNVEEKSSALGVNNNPDPSPIKPLDVSVDKKELENSFDLFKTCGQSANSSAKKLLLAQRSPLQMNGSTDDLWTDDDMFDESFVKATQVILDKDGFQSPKYPPAKRPMCNTPEAMKMKPFSFNPKTVANKYEPSAGEVMNTVNPVSNVSRESNGVHVITEGNQSTVSSTIVASVGSSKVNHKSSTVLTSVSSSDLGKSSSVSIASMMEKSMSSDSEPLSMSNSGKLSTMKLPFQSYKQQLPTVRRQSDEPNDATVTQESSKFIPPTQKNVPSSRFQRHASMPVVAGSGQIPHSKPVLMRPMNKTTLRQTRQPAPSFRQPNPNMMQTAPNFRQPVPRLPQRTAAPFRQPVIPPQQPVAMPRQQNIQVPRPRFSHARFPLNQVADPKSNEPNLRQNSTQKLTSGITDGAIKKTHLPVISDASLVNWSFSEFGATSTQIEKPVNHRSGNEGCSKSIVSRPPQAGKSVNNTVGQNKPETAFSKPKSTVRKPELCMDESISDDVLASLAEPDDLLDSQACMALLETDDIDFDSEVVTMDKVSAPSSMDHLDFMMLDSKPGKTAPRRSIKTDPSMLNPLDGLMTDPNLGRPIPDKNDPTKEVFDDFEMEDDLDADVLCLLDEVELRASQEKNQMTTSKAAVVKSDCQVISSAVHQKTLLTASKQPVPVTTSSSKPVPVMARASAGKFTPNMTTKVNNSSSINSGLWKKSVPTSCREMPGSIVSRSHDMQPAKVNSNVTQENLTGVPQTVSMTVSASSSAVPYTEVPSVQPATRSQFQFKTQKQSIKGPIVACTIGNSAAVSNGGIAAKSHTSATKISANNPMDLSTMNNIVRPSKPSVMSNVNSLNTNAMNAVNSSRRPVRSNSFSIPISRTNIEDDQAANSVISCSPDEIEKKRREALQKRQKLKLSRTKSANNL